MTMTLSGSGTIGGLVAGGLPDATIVQADLASGVAGNGPAFSAYQNNPSQSIGAATYTKVQLSSENFDTSNCFDSTTNYRFTPNVAGYYQINAQAAFLFATQARTTVFVYKNGNISVTGSGNAVPLNGSNAVASSVSTLIYMNGTTDYLEMYVFSGSATTLTYQGSTNDSCYMNGFLARAA